MKGSNKKSYCWECFVFVSVFLLNISCKSIETSHNKTSDIFFEHTQIKNDTSFKNNQEINIIKLQNYPNDHFNIEIGYSKSALKTTSDFGKSENAIGAINGSYFDMDKGGSVTYLEINDTAINNTFDPEIKWAKSNSLINGAIILYKNNTFEIQPKKSDQFYSKSKKEKAVIISGPILLHNAKRSKMFDSKFVQNKHPRTCVCKTKESILFVTIDGRRSNAKGMDLFELQDFLLDLGCIEAINLDGGGSTTMWIDSKGVVNQPSDKTGERPVANVFLIMKNDKK
ncbi:MAG: phosphodiester glycosidase family protein [Bacteroidota bacterium]